MSLVVQIRVTPNAKKARWMLNEQGILCCYVTAQPVDGKANKAVIKDLSKRLGLPQNAINLVWGNTERIKRFEIMTDMSMAQFLGYLGIEQQKSLI